MQLLKSVSHWVRPVQLISPQSAGWIIDCFAYAMKSFDSTEFFERTVLIQPSNKFFPGDVGSVEEKAENVFKHSLKYAGLVHWPFVLVNPHSFTGNNHLAAVNYSSIRRNSIEQLPIADEHTDEIPLSYNPQQTLKPQDLASSYAQLFAQHLIYFSSNKSLEEQGRFEEASEVVAVFLGFGVLLANSAYTFRGGCGSCFNPAANRQASLSESEIIFALAIFCKLKKTPLKEAKKHLKTHLKSDFDTAMRQLNALLKSNANLFLEHQG